MTDITTQPPSPYRPLHLHVHPGIGDFAWLYCKFSRLDRPLYLTIAEDDSGRSMPFVQMLPNVARVDYGNGKLDYEYLKKCWNGTYAEILEAESKGSKIYASCNNWLDNGRRLEEWLPDLPTDFHFDIPLSADDYNLAERLLPPGAMYFCIHTASLGGVASWDGWGPGEWLDFANAVHLVYPHVVFVLIGAKWDKDLNSQLRPLMLNLKLPIINLVGMLPLSVSLAVIQRCRYMVGFASGMTILAEIMRIPVLMLYPNHLDLLRYSWPSPQSIASRAYTGELWCRPKSAYRKIITVLEQALQ
jgi:hypothetical protein